MNVLSIFDGMSCGRIALERAGIPVTSYYASEIDKHAIKVSNRNWPDIVHIGDVCAVRVCNLPIVPDLVIAGSPCQGFSFAGKRLNFEDPRSKLFWEFVRILKECHAVNPDVKFMLENVRMDKRSEGVISDALGVLPIVINSALVSAQNRVRLYWTNIGETYTDLSGMRVSTIPQPEDRGLVLRDIIERGKSPALLAKGGGGAQPTKISIQPSDDGYRKKSKTVRGGGRGTTPDKRQEWDNVLEVSYRKLTVIECERLQTVPDGYTEGVSNTQRYKMLGNGWTVDVIAHIFSHLKKGDEVT